jgi:serine/threonine protein kinase
MPLVKERNTEPIPGYRLLERLGRGGFGEVWKCEAPGGLFKAVKFVYGNLDGLDSDRAQAEEEGRAIDRIKAIRHPFLLSIDRVEVVGGELLIVTELADKNLYALFQERRQAGLPGIGRAELLAYLREAAEALDLLNHEHGLQHLDIKPHNLFLVSKHVKVGDFGLVSSLGAGGIPGGAITPLYASPEVFKGALSPQSDQYSLAVVYQELLTGQLPFQGKNARQLLIQHTRGEPDLSPLPEADRHVVARALAKDPEQRFPSCQDFVSALRALAGRGASASSSAAQPAAEGHADEAATLPYLPARPPEAEADTDRSLRVTPGGNPPVPATPPAHRAVPAISALAGYRFLECLGSTPLRDAWRVQAPDGRQRLVELIYGAAPESQRLEDALVRFPLLAHPALAERELVQCEPGRLVLVTDLIHESLRDRFQQCQGQRPPGLPRDELLGYLRAAAEALDYLYEQHSIQHLGLSPRTLLLDRGRLVLAEFGLAQLFWLPAGQGVAERNARYAAPELFDALVSRSSDQFSLAIIYQEMLTGRHPFGGQSARAAAEGKPDLEALPDADREIVGRALSADPAQRWPSCTELVRVMARESALKSEAPSSDRFSQRLRGAGAAGSPAVAPAAAGSPLGQIIAQLITSAGGSVPAAAAEDAPTLSADRGLLHHKFSAGVPLGTARLKLDAFRQQWYGQLIREDEEHYVFHVSMPARFWRQWIGRQPGLEVQVRLVRQHARAATPIDVTVEIRAFRCTRKRGAELLGDMGTDLLESLRAALLVNAEKRIQDRLLWPHALQVRPVQADGTLGPAVVCRGKDISLSGIGFYLPHELPTAEVCIELPATPQTPALSVPATLVRAKRCADGWYEVGALFRLTALRKSRPEVCIA